MTQTQAISAKILAVIEMNGCTVREAMDVVLGNGTYEKLASDLYDAFKAKEVV